MIGKAIYNILSSTSNVTDICGTRIYPVNRPQEIETPAVIYESISGTANPTKTGESLVDTITLDISAWAINSNTADELLAECRSALENIKGTYNTINIISSFVTIPPRDGNLGTTQIFSRIITISFRVKY